MNFAFENQGASTYLVYEIGPTETVDSMCLGMLTNNMIPGLANVTFTQMDMTKYIKYNVSAKVSLSQLFSGIVTKQRVLDVFSGIVNAILTAEDYMIDPDSIVLDLDYIFVDVSNDNVILICLPVIGDLKPKENLGMFFKNIVFSMQFDQRENGNYVVKLIHYLNNSSAFSLMEFKKLLDNLKNTTFEGQQTQNTNTVSQAAVTKTPTQSNFNNGTNASQNGMQPNPNHGGNALQNGMQPNPNNGTSVLQNGMQHNPNNGTSVLQNGMQPNNSSNMYGGGYGGTVYQNKNVSNGMQQNNGMQSNGNQINIPNSNQGAQTINNSKSGEKMTMFKLLRNYSKENAQLYKEQKAAEKAGKDSKKLDKKKNNANKNEAFTVPGAPIHDFAIPGEKTSIVSQTTQNQSNAHSNNYVNNGMQSQQTYSSSNGNNVQNSNQTGYQQQINVSPKYQSGNYGDTTILGNGTMGATTVLAQGMVNESNPHLIRMKNNEKILLNKPVFRIGKEKSYVDYFIGDNTAVSRSHANIVNHDGNYFIVDTNSTNHTYVNQVMIQSNVETPIVHNTKIRLANEDFEFRMY